MKNIDQDELYLKDARSAAKHTRKRSTQERHTAQTAISGKMTQGDTFLAKKNANACLQKRPKDPTMQGRLQHNRTTTKREEAETNKTDSHRVKDFPPLSNYHTGHTR